MRVRDWLDADHYQELGVRPTATRAEIAAAFRARARVLHPDVDPDDPSAPDEFVRAAAAYRVLTGPDRAEYDRARRRGQVGHRPPRPEATRDAPAESSRPQWRLTRRGGRLALWGGIALVVAGITAGALVVTLQVRDARLRTGGVGVEALIVREDGVPRLEFSTRSGAEIRADVPDPKSGGWSVGSTVPIRYDPDDPTRVVTARQNLGRDITLWIVAAKLLIVGAVLTVIGARRLLRRPASLG